MLRRLGTGVALASMAALVLVGCSPPAPTATTSAAEPSAPPTASLSDNEMLVAAQASYQDLLRAVSAQYEAQTSDPQSLRSNATAEFAADLASQIDENLAQRLQLLGAPQITQAVLDVRSTDALSAGFCLDAAAVRVVDPQSGVELPATSSTTTAWTVDFILEDGQLIAAGRSSRVDELSDPCD
ncbi:hypothetical protein [Agrococcus beijingensis]|uniref:hypothetical protein n=1 Tax=Agrococcus beijingensis TaxID=3068634 RepID=UPI00274158F5|nr:hypothetical protein [Agrococcus sp. REN33]